MLATGIILVNSACELKNEKEHTEETVFFATSPFKKDTSITAEYVCQLHAIQHIELRAMEKGYLQGIYVDEGELVHEGQLMFKVMPMIYQAELQKALAEVNFAQIEYENTKNLADSNVVSANELALVKAKYDMAKADLSLAQVHLDFTEIRAPFDGIMNRFEVRLGSLIDEGELLTVLSDNRKMWAYFNVPEAEYLEYKTRIKKDSLIRVRLLLANNKIFDYEGVVETIVADFNNNTGNIAFRATFPNKKDLLRHGETGNILMEVPLKGALLIPQKATYEILDKKYVFVIDDQNQIHARRITVEAEMPHLYSVKTGLEEGEKILLEGLRKVKENDEITFEFVEPKTAISNLDLYTE